MSESGARAAKKSSPDHLALVRDVLAALAPLSPEAVGRAAAMVRRAPRWSTDDALCVGEFLDRRLAGLVAHLEARGDRTEALALVSGLIDMLQALRERVPATGKDSVRSLIVPAEQLLRDLGDAEQTSDPETATTPAAVSSTDAAPIPTGPQSRAPNTLTRMPTHGGQQRFSSGRGTSFRESTRLT